MSKNGKKKEHEIESKASEAKAQMDDSSGRYQRDEFEGFNINPVQILHKYCIQIALKYKLEGHTLCECPMRGSAQPSFHSANYALRTRTSNKSIARREKGANFHLNATLYSLLPSSKNCIRRLLVEGFDAEAKSKFEFSGHIRHWIFQSLGVKWRNYKITLKAEHWDSIPIEEILETVPTGVDQMQWCQLVNQWSKPEDQTQACNLLAKEGLTPEDENIKANERVFTIVMGPEHSGQVHTQGFSVKQTIYFSQSKSEEGSGSGSNFG
ncbi:hypothetical protein IEQ34_008825 [Dendrobium chrysotoxum]|uniref:Uncharacterized protein n=1 Tax=Dendrobium chrysotoxum TaxID=161865 RepID=A0AAV7GHI9_DENCH|nr:hypothetical protein IEQ34_008825 [Dendrobium chrysotoxum]